MFPLPSLARIGPVRKQLALTQKELARLAGVSQSLIAKIEGGRIDPAYSKVGQIMAALEQEQKKEKKTVDQILSKNVISVLPSDKLTKAISLMREKEISQLPVMQSGVCLGGISEKGIINLLGSGEKEGEKELRARIVGEIMGDAFPVLPAGSSADAAADLLKHYDAVLIGNEGKIIGIITKMDLFKSL